MCVCGLAVALWAVRKMYISILCNLFLFAVCMYVSVLLCLFCSVALCLVFVFPPKVAAHCVSLVELYSESLEKVTNWLLCQPLT